MECWCTHGYSLFGIVAPHQPNVQLGICRGCVRRGVVACVPALGALWVYAWGLVEGQRPGVWWVYKLHQRHTPPFRRAEVTRLLQFTIYKLQFALSERNKLNSDRREVLPTIIIQNTISISTYISIYLLTYSILWFLYSWPRYKDIIWFDILCVNDGSIKFFVFLNFFLFSWVLRQYWQ